MNNNNSTDTRTMPDVVVQKYNPISNFEKQIQTNNIFEYKIQIALSTIIM